jgi:alpha-1,6-mannosyltransferase
MLKRWLRNPRILYLAALAGASIFATLMFRAGITRYACRPFCDSKLGESLLDAPHPARWLFNAGFLVASLAYCVWLLRNADEVRSFRTLVCRALPFLGLGYLAYPISEDIYLYLTYGSMGLSGANPYVLASDDIQTPMVGLFHWRVTSTYGPFAMLIFMGSAVAVPYSPVAGIYLFKVFCLLAHVANGYLVWRIVGGGPLRSKLASAYLLNPCLISFHIGDAHVDVFLCTWILLMAGALRSRAYVAAFLAGWGGMLTKTLPIIWMPLLGAFLIRRRRWKEIGVAALVTIGIVGILSATILPTPDAWASLLNPATAHRYARSIYHMFQIALQKATSLDTVDQAWLLSRVELLGLSVYVAYYCGVWLKVFFARRQEYGESDLIADMGWVTLALLLLATPWMMPWYPTVLLPLAVLSGRPFFALSALAFSLTTELVYGDGATLELRNLVHSAISIFPIAITLALRRRLSEAAQGWWRRMTITPERMPKMFMGRLATPAGGHSMEPHGEHA